jgi:hypothetical protein
MGEKGENSKKKRGQQEGRGAGLLGSVEDGACNEMMAVHGAGTTLVKERQRECVGRYG